MNGHADPAPPPLAAKALVVENGIVAEIDPLAVAAYAGPGFVWLHAEGMGELNIMDLPGYVPQMAANALVAHETRPRCDEIDDAVLINLRGTALEAAHGSDGLVSIRVWVEERRVTSVSRYPLAALGKVEALMRAGKITDGGDFVALLAQAISKELDPQVADLGDSLDDCEGMHLCPAPHDRPDPLAGDHPAPLRCPRPRCARRHGAARIRLDRQG
jgi:zinc transporter